MTSSVEAESEEKSPLMKSKGRKDAKISVQDLHTKLDQAVAENSQIRKFLSPTALQQAFTTTLQATRAGPENTDKKGTGKNFWASAENPSSQQGWMALQTQRSPVDIAKIWGMN